MVDVLDAVTNLYKAQQQCAIDRYFYIINIITLKQQAGTLYHSDLAQINTWLGQFVRFDVKQKVRVSKYAKISPPTAVKQAIPPKWVKPKRYFHNSLLKSLGHHSAKPSTHFAVQVFASRKLADVKAFKEKQSDKNNLQIINEQGLYKGVIEVIT